MVAQNTQKAGTPGRVALVSQDLADVTESLERARELGLLGPAPVDQHVRHAQGFVAAIGQNAVGTLLDLGSGAGVPGLLLAAMLPQVRVVLLDANLRRTTFSASVVEDLELSSRVMVLRDRAEEAGRLPAWRERFDVVVGRAFGAPGPTAECGSPFLRVDGLMVVSEPPRPDDRTSLGEPCLPEAKQRWPPSGLWLLGLIPGERVFREGFSLQVLEKKAAISDRFPRRSGLPGQRPLF